MLPAPVELPTTVNHWLISNLKLPGKHAIPIDMNELEAGQRKKTTRQGNPRRVVCRSRLKGFQSFSITPFSERKQHWPERRDACWSLEHLDQQLVLALVLLPCRLRSRKLARSHRLVRKHHSHHRSSF